MEAEPTTHSGARRFAHLDTLRAVSALMVAWYHLSERFLPFVGGVGTGAFLYRASRVLNFGRLGVLLFFAISGFVIYASLSGSGTNGGRRFMLTRFFRLYPAYWLSLAAGLLVYWWCRGESFGAYLILANATMLPRFLHASLVLGVYWTLETELIFYAACWMLWRGGWLENRRVLAVLIIGLCAVWWMTRTLIHLGVVPSYLPANYKAMPRHLALMFWGAYVRVVYDETEGFRARLAGNRQVWLVAGLGLLLMALDGPKNFRIMIHPHAFFPSPYTVAPALFALWVAVCRVRWGALAWLGRISYSFYLFHLVVALPLVTWLAEERNAAWRGWPLGLYMMASLVPTVGLSAAIYYSVERPAIALGRRLTAASIRR